MGLSAPVPRNLRSTVPTGYSWNKGSSSNSCSLTLGWIIRSLPNGPVLHRERVVFTQSSLARPKDWSSAPVRRDRTMGKSRETVPQSRRQTRRAIERANAFTTCSLTLSRVASVSRHDIRLWHVPRNLVSQQSANPVQWLQPKQRGLKLARDRPFTESNLYISSFIYFWENVNLQ
jgi:hypothetical protein